MIPVAVPPYPSTHQLYDTSVIQTYNLVQRNHRNIRSSVLYSSTSRQMMCTIHSANTDCGYRSTSSETVRPLVCETRGVVVSNGFTGPPNQQVRTTRQNSLPRGAAALSHSGFYFGARAREEMLHTTQNFFFVSFRMNHTR